MPAVNALLGAIVLFFGRSLYWVLVGIIGFLVGMQLVEGVLGDQELWVRVAAAVLAGVVGALVAVIAHRVAFALAGFFAGGYLAFAAAEAFSPDAAGLIWFLAGAVVGAVLAALLMDWAIIVLSSLVGAGAIVSAFALDPAIAVVVYTLLVVAGIVVQSRMTQDPPTEPAT